MGVTAEGYKRVLGFTEAMSEHSVPIKDLFRDLLERDLRFAGGVPCTTDGSKRAPESHHRRLWPESARPALSMA